MPKFVIDTSIILKWISHDKETGVKEALEIFRLLKGGKIALYAPSFLMVELINILYWKNKFTPSEIKSFVTRIQTSGINFIDSLERNAEAILELVLANKITAYDAIFLSQAKDLNAKLISADNKLLGLKDMVINPTQVLDETKDF